MVATEQAYYKYQIAFPGGEIWYLPVEGKIIDPVRKRTVPLPEKRKFSLLSTVREKTGSALSVFKPVCLTIYAGHRCNLNCTYCYVPHKEKYPEGFIDPAIVGAGARLVARSCRERNLPFVTGFHGGNEPLLYPEKIKTYLDICESAAKKENLEFLSFCTTNGVIPEDTAIWAAKTFHGITLSWDGPPGVHDVYRRDRSGRMTAGRVEKSAKLFSAVKGDAGKFLVRCTITSTSVEKMEEIIRYFSLAGVKAVEFYPLFQNGEGSLPEEMKPDPRKFVYHFLKARSLGLSEGITVLFSGARIDDFHNRFCMTLQDNLTITPDGYLTNCYYHTWNSEKQLNRFFYGKYEEERDLMEIDDGILQQIIKKYDEDPDVCRDCFNRFHCSHGCPDVCPFNGRDNTSVKPDCTREKWLGLAAILEKAGYLKNFDSEPECADFFQHITCSRI